MPEVIRGDNYNHLNSELNRWTDWKMPLEVYDKPYYPPYCGGNCCMISAEYLMATKLQVDLILFEKPAKPLFDMKRR